MSRNPVRWAQMALGIVPFAVVLMIGYTAVAVIFVIEAVEYAVAGFVKQPERLEIMTRTRVPF